MARTVRGLAGGMALLVVTAVPATAAPGRVEVVDNGFSPGTVTVDAGESVTWRQTGQAVHDVTGDGFSSGYMYEGSVFTHTFTTPGSHDYVCTLHPAMTGTVVVREAAAPPPPPPSPTPPPPAPSPTPTPSPTVAPPPTPTSPPPADPDPGPTTAAPAPTASLSDTPAASQTTSPSDVPASSDTPSSSATPSPTDTGTDATPRPGRTTPETTASTAAPSVTPIATQDAGTGGRGWLVALLVLAIGLAIGGGVLVARHRRT